LISFHLSGFVIFFPFYWELPWELRLKTLGFFDFSCCLDSVTTVGIIEKLFWRAIVVFATLAITAAEIFAKNRKINAIWVTCVFGGFAGSALSSGFTYLISDIGA
jgi:hypothetical protein